jgi:hypothetical protein
MDPRAAVAIGKCLKYGTCGGSGGSFGGTQGEADGPAMTRIIILVLSLALPGEIAGAATNPWIYESGKGRFHYAQYDYGFDRHFGRKGHRHWASGAQRNLPLPGKCRVWFLSRVPGC